MSYKGDHTKSKILQIHLHKSDVPNQFQNLFKSALWYCFNIKLRKFFSIIFFFLHFFLFTWNIFLCLAFYSSQIWLDIQAREVHLKHSEATRTFKALKSSQGLGHSESTQRALGHLGTWIALGHSEGTQAIWHIRHLCTRTLKTLRYLGTFALKGTQALGHLEQLET